MISPAVDAVAGHIVVFRVNDAKLRTGIGISGHGLELMPLFGRALHVWLQFGGGQRGRALGETVSRKTMEAELFFDLTNQRGRRRGAADHGPLHAAQVVPGTRRRICESNGHDRHQTQRAHSLLLHQTENLFGQEARKHDVRSADESDGVSGSPTVGVKERDGVHHDVLVARVMIDGEAHSVQVDVAMGEHHTFWAGAGSAGVEDFCDGIFIKGHQVRSIGSSRGEHLLVGLTAKPCGLRRSVELNERVDGLQVAPEGIDQRDKFLFQE